MCASYELYTETKLRIGKLDGRVDRGTSVASGVRAHQRAGDGAPLAVSRMGTNASTINFCAEPITWTRRTASQEVVESWRLCCSTSSRVPGPVCLPWW